MEFRFDKMFSSNLGKENSDAGRIKCPRIINSMHLAKPAALVWVYPLIGWFFHCQQEILIWWSYILPTDNEEVMLRSQRISESLGMQWNKLVGSDLDLKNTNPFISGGGNQGRTQGGEGLGLTPPWACNFTKTLLHAQRRLIVFAYFLFVNLST